MKARQGLLALQVIKSRLAAQDLKVLTLEVFHILKRQDRDRKCFPVGHRVTQAHHRAPKIKDGVTLAHVDIQWDHTIEALHLRRGLRAIQDLLTTTRSKLWLCKPWPIGKPPSNKFRLNYCFQTSNDVWSPTSSRTSKAVMCIQHVLLPSEEM